MLETMCSSLDWHYLPEMPDEDAFCLVIVTEPDIFNGGETPPFYALLMYNAERREWNTKASFYLHAWAKLPPVPGGMT